MRWDEAPCRRSLPRTSRNEYWHDRLEGGRNALAVRHAPESISSSAPRERQSNRRSGTRGRALPHSAVLFA
jgi:hypothetical protein